MRVMNFGAGPGTLPLPALERAQRELCDFAGTGMSVMEHSHRGKEYGAVHEEAQALLRELLALPDSHEVLFLQGGATQQFALVPMNFLAESGARGAYLVSGTWGDKALSEGRAAARLVGGEVYAALDTGTGEGKARSWTRAPSASELAALRSGEHTAYVHATSNETIHGVQLPSLPEAPAGVPLVVDMSSDFLSRPTDFSRCAFAYAGAQKNIGPSGVVVAIAHKDLLARSRRDLPKIFQYRAHAEAGSLLNTPSTFGIYLVRNVLAWVKESGGLAQMAAWNEEKARLVYGAIDARPDFYRCPVEPASRSQMNVVFRLPSEELEAAFLAEAKRRKMVGLKGHRSVGGVRVSLYNAVPVEWAAALADLMTEFAAGK